MNPAWLALPLTRLDLPGAGRVLHALGGFDDARWTDAGSREVVLRPSAGGGRVTLDLSEKLERFAFFLRRYHELPIQLLMRACIRPGEIFVDVGANLGLLSLLGSALVGTEGRVVAYEPNPAVFTRFAQHIRRNRRDNISPLQQALGAMAGELELTVIGANTGTGTLGHVPPELAHEVRHKHRVAVVRGDDSAAAWLTPAGAPAPTFLKIDAEGAETAILRGLRQTLASRRPLVVVEVNAFALRMNRSTPRHLRAELQNLGYEGWDLQARRNGWSSRARLAPLPPLPVEHLHDEVWAHPEGPHWERLASLRG